MATRMNNAWFKKFKKMNLQEQIIEVMKLAADSANRCQDYSGLANTWVERSFLDSYILLSQIRKELISKSPSAASRRPRA
jgi:spore cortex formation protein SpoVR/YcgB (stage V sporulation)